MSFAIRSAKHLPILSWLTPKYGRVGDIIRIYFSSLFKKVSVVRFTDKTDAAFANPDVYEYLEVRGFLCRRYGLCNSLMMSALVVIFNTDWAGIS